MLRSHIIVFMVSLGLSFSLLTCSKEKLPELPSEKIPLSTQSLMAQKEFQTGRDLVDKLQNTEAARHFQKAITLDPGFAMAWLQLAYVSPEASQFLSALDSAKFYAGKSSIGEQLIIKAAEYGVQQNNMRQRATLNQLVAKYPGDELAHLLLGNYYFGVQQYKLAIKSFTNAIIINENMLTPYNQLGYSQRALGNYGEAEKAFKLYINLNPENPNAYDSYAELLMEMGRYNESIEYYKQALAIDPRFTASHIGISCNYSFMGEPAKAREQLQILKSKAQNKRDIRRAIYTEAISYLYEGNIKSAIEQVQINLDKAKENKDIANIANDLIFMGNLYLELGQPEEALDNYNRSMRWVNNSEMQIAILENHQIIHLFNIARVFSAQGDFQRAEQTAQSFYSKVLEKKNPVQMRLSFQLDGIIALEQNQYGLAAEKLQQANQLNPLNLYLLGQAYKGLGRSQDAELMVQRAAELNVLNNMDQALVLSKTKFKKTV